MPIELKVKLHEKGGCYFAGKGRPGMSKAKVQELLPDIIIPENEPIDEHGWWKSPEIENMEQCVARVKDIVKDFKEMYKSDREKYGGKTFVAISHGSLLSTLACIFTNNLANVNLECFIPENNSLSILDFVEVKEGQKDYIDCRLTAFNMKLK